MYILQNCLFPSIYCSYDDSHRYRQYYWAPMTYCFLIAGSHDQYYFRTYTCIHTVYFESTGRRTTGRPSCTYRYYIIVTIIDFNLTRLPRLPGHTNSWPKYVYRTKTVPPENFFRTNIIVKTYIL